MHTFLFFIACAAPSVEVLWSDDSTEEKPNHVRLTDASSLVFASAQQGRELLGRRDLYIQSQAALERQIRLHSETPVSAEAFVEHVQRQVLPWSDDERKQLTATAAAISEKMRGLEILMPEEVLLIRTTGKDESGAAYTRSEGVVLPLRRVPLKPAAQERLLVHELFHVISRHDPNLRQQLYAVIGFQPCDPIQLPESIAKQQITNPDAPTVDYYISIEHEGEDVDVVPILLTDRDDFDPRRNKLFDYLQFRLLVVHRVDERWQPKLDEDGVPVLIDGRANTSYREKIGRNTEYIIHPDEILADNFVHLLMQTKDLKSPEIVEKMRDILVGEKAPQRQGDTEEKT